MAKTGKFVLSVGDEGGILTYFHGAQVSKRLYAQSSGYSDTRSFLQAFESDPKAPIYLLVDMMDQSYVQQTLPPVSSLSVNQLIKRKMNRDSAPDDLKGALLIGRESGGRRDWNYLFVTISNSPQLQAWIDLVIELPNPFRGIYPLPVEAESFVHRLRESLTGRSFKARKGAKKGVEQEESAKWQLLVAHNKVGGFRQVVLREGKLIFARLAQPISDTQPAVVAGSIEQEVSVTVEYLKRLGYRDDEGMEAFIITSEDICRSISPANIHVSSVHVLSPYQAAQHLGLSGATEPTDQFADSLLAAAFITAKKHKLVLSSPQTERITKLYMAIMGVQVAAGLLSIAALGTLGYYGVSIPVTSSAIEREKTQVRSANSQLEELRVLEQELPDDLETITDLLAMHRQLNDLGVTPLESLYRYSVARGDVNMLLNKFEWEVQSTLLTASSQSNNYGGGDSAANAEKVKAEFKIDFFETQRGTNGFNDMLDTYLKRVEEVFPGYAIEVKGRPGISEGEAKEITLVGDNKDELLAKPSHEVSVIVQGSDAKEGDDANAQQNGQYNAYGEY